MALGIAVLAFFGAFDSERELLDAGVPELLAPLAAMGVAAMISWARNLIAVKWPQWNVVKKLGAGVQPILKR